MRSNRLLVVASTAATATVFCVYVFAAERQSASTETRDLPKRVATLEEKVARLEKTLTQLTVPANPPAVGPLVPPLYVPPVPQAAPRQPEPHVAPNGKPYEFNGQTYYIVPLSLPAAAQANTQHGK